MICERCGVTTDKLYEASDDNSMGERITLKICWDCDHDVINGGDLFEDEWHILADRIENAYQYDPINNPRPY